MHIEWSVPGPEQKVECLIDRIICTDITLQSFIGIIIANTNNMQEDFKAEFSSFIEINPYRRPSRIAGRNSVL